MLVNHGGCRGQSLPFTCFKRTNTSSSWMPYKMMVVFLGTPSIDSPNCLKIDNENQVLGYHKRGSIQSLQREEITYWENNRIWLLICTDKKEWKIYRNRFEGVKYKRNRLLFQSLGSGSGSDKKGWIGEESLLAHIIQFRVWQCLL